MSKEGHIDLDRISTSIETLASIENVVNIVDLDDSFEDIEKCFRQVNFEHSNCLNYKESIETIYQDIEQIKKKVNELSDALRRTKENYINIDTFSDEDIKEFTQIYRATASSEDLAKLVGTDNHFHVSALVTDLSTSQNQGTVTTVPVPDTSAQQTQSGGDSFNTLPIGIAIGATGIAGSVGAVVVDDIYRSKEKKNKRVSKNDVYIEEYNEDDILDEDYDYDQIRRSSGIAQGPYRAARMAREADRFYGNQLQEMQLADDGDDYGDDFEDDDEK